MQDLARARRHRRGCALPPLAKSSRSSGPGSSRLAEASRPRISSRRAPGRRCLRPCNSDYTSWKLETRRRLRLDREEGAGTPGRLRAICGEIGRAIHVLRRRLVRRHARDAAGEAVLAVPDLGERLLCPLGDLDRVLGGRPGQDDAELVPTETAGDVGRTDGRRSASASVPRAWSPATWPLTSLIRFSPSRSTIKEPDPRRPAGCARRPPRTAPRRAAGCRDLSACPGRPSPAARRRAWRS